LAGDEIKTVDDIVLDPIKDGRDVYDVKYKPPPAPTTLSRLLAAGTESDNGARGPIDMLVQSLVKALSKAIRAEIITLNVAERPAHERYMAFDDTNKRMHSQY
jgi:hypothetical protein